MRPSSISVIITCYNYARYLKGCLESVLSQTFTDLEIIVVNDGSTDDTDDVVREFRSCDNIKYVKQPNAGQAIAKNTGINHASGALIAFLDADDVWDKDKLTKQLPLFNREAVGVVYSRARYVDEKGQAQRHFESPGKYLVPRSGNIINHLIIDNFIPFSSSIIRRDCLEKYGNFDESLKMGIDWDLWLRVATGYEFDFVDEPLMNYRTGHLGQMSKNMEERQRCSDRIMKQFLLANNDVISSWAKRKAYSYTYWNRGEYYRAIDWRKSVWYFLKAIHQNPAETLAYKGLLKCIVSIGGSH